MAKSPAVLWYTGDYLVGVIGMTFEEQGRYSYLLNLQHQRGHLDIESIMPDCPDTVLAKFVQDDEGLWYNERMEKEIYKRDKFVESRRGNLKGKGEKNKPKEIEAPDTTALARTDIYNNIIKYLNERAGTNYRASGQATRNKIDARLNEGFKEEDFYTVIDKKCDDWLGTEYEKFLRPETLFGNKFEGYLNQRKRPHGTGNSFLDILQEL